MKSQHSGGLWVRGQPVLHSQILSQTKPLSFRVSARRLHMVISVKKKKKRVKDVKGKDNSLSTVFIESGKLLFKEKKAMPGSGGAHL